MDILRILIHGRVADRRRRARFRQMLRVHRANMRLLRDNSNPYEMPEERFRGLYRLSKDLALALTEELRPFLRQSQRVTSIPVELRVLSALNVLAQGSYQKSVGADFNATLSQASVSVCLAEVVGALNQAAVLSRQIRFPETTAERTAIIQRNFARYPYIPGVLGMVDGTHIAVVAPAEHEELHVNRKKFHSMNVQIACDANYIILNILARYPGATHDSFIWANSALNRRMEELYRRGEQCWLLGDSGYPHQPWLHVPILNAEEGSPEANYTKAHMITRSSVERAIGHLKSRFRCLLKHRVLHYTPEKAGKIVNGCAVLHNMCVSAQLPLPSDDSDSSSDDDAPFEATPNNVPLLVEARALRQRLVTRTARVPPRPPQGPRRHRRGR